MKKNKEEERQKNTTFNDNKLWLIKTATGRKKKYCKG